MDTTLARDIEPKTGLDPCQTGKTQTGLQDLAIAINSFDAVDWIVPAEVPCLGMK